MLITIFLFFAFGGVVSGEILFEPNDETVLNTSQMIREGDEEQGQKVSMLLNVLPLNNDTEFEKMSSSIHEEHRTVKEDREENSTAIRSENSLLENDSMFEDYFQNNTNDSARKQQDLSDRSTRNETTNHTLFLETTNPANGNTPKKFSVGSTSNRSETDERACKSQLIRDTSKILRELNISLDASEISNVSVRGAAQSVDEFGVMKVFVMFAIDVERLVEAAGMVGRAYEMSSEKLSRLLSTPQNKSEDDDSLRNIRVNFIDQRSVVKAKLVQEIENRKDSNKTRINIGLEMHVQKKTRAEATTEGAPSAFAQLRNRKRHSKKRVETFSRASTYFGSALALASSVLCGVSFVLKKRSLIPKAGQEVDLALSAHEYLKNRAWWWGHSLMILGDTLHFAAFYFAPAIVVCTLQMLTVLVAAIASSKLLGERVSKYGRLAFALCLSGCWVIVFHAPKEPHVYSTDNLFYMISDPVFLCYLLFLFVFCMPRWGTTNSLVFTLQSSIFGSIIMICLKGTALGYTETWRNWVPWTSLVLGGIFILFQLEYLNRALTMYNALVVTTQFYVMYSAWVILGSSLLFKVWQSSSFEGILVNFCGFVTIALGVVVFTIFQEDHATFDFSKLFAGPDRKASY